MSHSISPLLTVPNEVFYQIAKYLVRHDVISLLQTNRSFVLPLRSLILPTRANYALLHAAETNDLDLLKLALSAGADTTCKFTRRDKTRLNLGTALHRAAAHGNTAIITELLRYNAPLQAENVSMDTPLFSAARYSQQASVDLLLAAGSNPTPHCSGCYSNFFDVAAASGLISTALKFIHLAGDKSMHVAIIHKQLVIATQLAKRGFAIATHICDAVFAGVGFVQLCLDAGARINDVHFFRDAKCTALSLAAGNGDVEVVQLLLDRGANPNAGPKHVRPIMAAVRNGSPDVVRCLLKRGAVLTGLRNPGADVLVTACAFSPPRVVALLLDAEQGLELDGNPVHRGYIAPLHSAAENGNVRVIRLLLDLGAKVDARRGRRGETPLHYAARAGSAEAVEALLVGGADPRIECRGKTALQVAKKAPVAKGKKRSTMAALVEGGAEIGGGLK